MALLVHTADWHLGRILHGLHLTEDQRAILDGLVAQLEQRRPDCLLIAGDVYDRAVPPPEAVALLDQTLTRVVRDLGIPVVMIAGNHDSPDRLGFGARILQEGGLHVVGPGADDGAAEPVVLQDEHGPYEVHAIPFLEPALVRQLLGDDSISGQDAATAALVQRALSRSRGGRRVLVAHAFVEGGELGDTERPLSVGGSGAVAASRFEGFDYVALGHLHRRQQVGAGPLHYSGSLFKYSFSEVGHHKSVNLVSLGAGGLESVTPLPLRGPRDLRRLEGTLDGLLAAPAEGDPEDYLLVSLTDRGPVYDAAGKLRRLYPNVLHIERQELLPELYEAGAAAARARAVDERELFRRFFYDLTGEELTPEEQARLTAIMDGLRAADREATP